MLESLFEIARPVMQAFDSSRCVVVPVNYCTARVVVRETHYIGRLGATSVALGLYVEQQLGGVITFGTIPSNNAQAICGAEYSARVLELTRLALYDWMPRNSESWFIAQSFRWLCAHRPDVAILISYADSAAGHAGTIYQATNWTYTGNSTNDYVYAQDDGTIVHPRTTGRSKGALSPGRWTPVSAKHRYIIFIGPDRRRVAQSLRWESLPYPKLDTMNEAARRSGERAANSDRYVGT